MNFPVVEYIHPESIMIFFFFMLFHLDHVFGDMLVIVVAVLIFCFL